MTNKPLKNETINKIIGKQFGYLKIISYEYKNIKPNKKSYDYYYRCLCKCGKEGIVNRNNLLSKHTLSCGCLRTKSGEEKIGWKGYKDISGRFWIGIKNRAIKRKIKFSITKKYIWGLWLKQKGCCALSGIELNLKHKKPFYKNITASLDRIDSKKGYIKGNVQWVHKEINIIKRELNNKRFIELCNLVTNKNKKLC